jgi:hypothetical protein
MNVYIQGRLSDGQSGQQCSLVCSRLELMKWIFYTSICLEEPKPIIPPKQNSRTTWPGIELGTSQMRRRVLMTQPERSVR